MFKTLVNWLALIGLAFFISACTKQAEVISLSGNTMGTTYHIKVVPNERMPDAQLLQAEIDLALEQVNDQMSTYRPNSELSKFNQMTRNEKVEVSADTAKVIAEGLALYKTTDGALDITLGPLVNLWGFGPDKRPTQVPTQQEIDTARLRTGIESIVLEGNKLSKLNPDIYVDLSSIAKGFGVDKIAALLDKYQPMGYLVEIGGEISLRGTKADGSLWRIAIEKPDNSGNGIQQVISPKNMAMATSGDYRNYYEEDGKRFSHLIDPRTGYPINHRLASVTVLHKESMIADGYATAMMVLGTQASLELANREHLAIMLIEKQDDGFKVFYSEAFKPFVTQ
ncbi:MULTISPECIES: FAD:protein FMN transferase [Shewanella]|uniref:FAD:protein FMN transferase n=1 Tax=Shewanella fidelis TaxID=173509 RepID=A0AAW8NK09_9GAMM|nr:MULTISPECIES: FAD:protein FMN transferase [Shewanella]MDR8522861.1 FAD:protein FMN transferase [Shewanella fidelis]MDW4811813.1 FAD:protein FMN transferase [Shewanella fidelis]MDW4818093.1 FAD:protein FMN transferase [Shewanella fidelis]MDW4822160.1 FAD:protein FMN transferase [Shewanella fidelis]MDW4826377.1 FAD:protein FMN transferase [Shewanella fidelis]